jgi:hypothetical protein
MAFSPSDHKSIIIGKRGFLEADTVQRFLVKPERRVLALGSHLLVQDILDIIGPIGVVREGLFHGLDER